MTRWCVPSVCCAGIMICCARVTPASSLRLHQSYSCTILFVAVRRTLALTWAVCICRALLPSPWLSYFATEIMRSHSRARLCCHLVKSKAQLQQHFNCLVMWLHLLAPVLHIQPPPRERTCPQKLRLMEVLHVRASGVCVCMLSKGMFSPLARLHTRVCTGDHVACVPRLRQRLAFSRTLLSQ